MSVLSHDGSTWSTKLERIGELATKDRGLIFNNVGHTIDVEMLREMYWQLDGKKAVGIDGIDKESYGLNLEENLRNLLQRMRKGTYQPQAGRVVEIPKEDGSTRPLVISCLEDKIVQSAVNALLTKIYEPTFLPCSYGFRPKRSCHDALRALSGAAFKAKDGAVVEIDLRKYFNTIPHDQLMDFLKRKISDRRFLSLINALLRSPIQMADGTIKDTDRGTPQGSIVSPVLSNVFLHYVIDEWFSDVCSKYFARPACEIRYADDMVFIFHDAQDAERFFRVLDKRLEKFGIQMHHGKSRLLKSGSQAAARSAAQDVRIPSYKFLGFSCYWGIARNGKFWRLKLKSRGDRKTAKLNGLRRYLRENRNTPDMDRVLATVVAGVKGWVNYHAVSDNKRAVKSFIEEGKRILFRWFNRRGGRRRMHWIQFQRILIRIGYPKSFKTVRLIPTPN